MINPNNKQLVDAIVLMIQNISRTHNALLYDVHMRLKEIRDKYGEDYPSCGTCRRPAAGVSRDCAECYARHPEYSNRGNQ